MPSVPPLIQSWLPSLFWVGLWLSIILGLAEWVSRKNNIDPEIPRKIVHIGTGNVILLAWWLQTPLSLGLVASILFCGVTLLSYRFQILPSVSGVGRKSWGTFFYALSIGILIVLFWGRSLPHLTAIGILVMTWGDGLAAIIGRRFGTHPYQIWGMNKSWEGTFTMFITSFSITSGILIWIYHTSSSVTLIAGMALAISAIATALEAFSKYGLDNLTVPIGTAGLCYSLIQWML